MDQKQSANRRCRRLLAESSEAFDTLVTRAAAALTEEEKHRGEWVASGGSGGNGNGAVGAICECG